MMAENPNWRWSLNNGSSSSLALDNSADDDDLLHNHGYPLSWTQLLVGGLASCDSNLEYNKMQVDDQKHCISDNETILISHGHNYISNKAVSDSSYHPVKQETIEHYKHHQQHKQLYDHTYNHYTDDDTSWSSCFKSLSSTENSHVTTYMDFSSDHRKRNQDGQVLLGDQSVSHHKCKDSSEPSGTPKKARVQPSSTHKPALKVKKERLGDRITALHQLVSPFGKTDTASVLLEAMGYIRFLEGQIQALTAPYSGNASSAGSVRIQQSVNEDELSAAAAAGKQDLRSRGLSLVSVDWAHHVNNTIGILDINNKKTNASADYWASSAL